MVWIHGGAWISGSGGTQIYGPQYLLDKDIILVTINYRLGTLGTLKCLNHLLKYNTPIIIVLGMSRMYQAILNISVPGRVALM
jgi:hypothetical protein